MRIHNSQTPYKQVRFTNYVYNYENAFDLKFGDKLVTIMKSPTNNVDMVNKTIELESELIERLGLDEFVIVGKPGRRGNKRTRE